MMKIETSWIVAAFGVALIVGCQKPAAPEPEPPADAEAPMIAEAPAAAAGEIDRTVLPIVPPKHAPITELDARKAKAPPLARRSRSTPGR